MSNGEITTKEEETGWGPLLKRLGKLVLIAGAVWVGLGMMAHIANAPSAEPSGLTITEQTAYTWSELQKAAVREAAIQRIGQGLLLSLVGWGIVYIARKVPSTSVGQTSVIEASDQSLFCSKCGVQNAASAQFCYKCGQGIIRGPAEQPRESGEPFTQSVVSPSATESQPVRYRNLWQVGALTLVALGLYQIYLAFQWSKEINGLLGRSKFNSKLMLAISICTLGIGAMVIAAILMKDLDEVAVRHNLRPPSVLSLSGLVFILNAGDVALRLLSESWLHPGWLLGMAAAVIVQREFNRFAASKRKDESAGITYM